MSEVELDRLGVDPEARLVRPSSFDFVRDERLPVDGARERWFNPFAFANMQSALGSLCNFEGVFKLHDEVLGLAISFKRDLDMALRLGENDLDLDLDWLHRVLGQSSINVIRKGGEFSFLYDVGFVVEAGQEEGEAIVDVVFDSELMKVRTDLEKAVVNHRIRKALLEQEPAICKKHGLQDSGVNPYQEAFEKIGDNSVVVRRAVINWSEESAWFGVDRAFCPEYGLAGKWEYFDDDDRIGLEHIGRKLVEQRVRMERQDNVLAGRQRWRDRLV
jgi:hypothetical protein